MTNQKMRGVRNIRGSVQNLTPIYSTLIPLKNAMSKKGTDAEFKRTKLPDRFVTNWGIRECFEFEKLHKGVFPSSKKGDFSDVKVVSPYGEIPWKELQRISETEMRKLMLAFEVSIHRAIYTLVGLEKMYPSKVKFEEVLENFIKDEGRISWDLSDAQLKKKYGDYYDKFVEGEMKNKGGKRKK